MIEEWAAKIKLLILDVDGVLTDGRIIINDSGEEIKCFHVRDGHGLRLLMNAGIHVVIITGRKSKTVEHRARDLGIREVYQGVKDKESLLKELIQYKNLDKEKVCCMGDDLPDLPMFNQVGVSIAVADACIELRTEADFVTRKRGGKGAVREVCELILKAQGKWPNTGLNPSSAEE
jgi:YrbI family 3-deoxy-D-manno-octulosonate 8-phosphate phosphatase